MNKAETEMSGGRRDTKRAASRRAALTLDGLEVRLPVVALEKRGPALSALRADSRLASSSSPVESV